MQPRFVQSSRATRAPPRVQEITSALAKTRSGQIHATSVARPVLAIAATVILQLQRALITRSDSTAVRSRWRLSSSSPVESSENESSFCGSTQLPDDPAPATGRPCPKTPEGAGGVQHSERSGANVLTAHIKPDTKIGGKNFPVTSRQDEIPHLVSHS